MSKSKKSQNIGEWAMVVAVITVVTLAAVFTIGDKLQMTGNNIIQALEQEN
ncbi:MAG: hypothetical protein MZV70_76500 [Desulfobacterales bacterium]|nr:hypothetical protein [Desulfobacterales bacterium]